MTPPADEALCSAVVAAMAEAVIVTDREQKIRIWNAGSEKLFGYAAQEAIGRPLDFVIPERLREAHNRGFARAVETGEMRAAGKVMTTRATPKDGRRLYVDFSFGLAKDANGAVTGVFAVGRDATERHLQQQAASKPAA
jgi:PAS domain S-box-containing protein